MPTKKITDNKNGTYTVPLTQGQVAIIDAEDVPYVGQYNWYAGYYPCIDGFYARRSKTFNNKQIKLYMHREILKCTNNQDADHINHNTLDNRRCNLRIVTRSQNCMNQKTQANAKSSIYKGVHWDNNAKKWLVRITINYIKYYIGIFSSEIEAAHMYDQFATQLFGEYALLNIDKMETKI